MVKFADRAASAVIFAVFAPTPPHASSIKGVIWSAMIRRMLGCFVDMVWLLPKRRGLQFLQTVNLRATSLSSGKQKPVCRPQFEKIATDRAPQAFARTRA